MLKLKSSIDFLGEYSLFYFIKFKQYIVGDYRNIFSPLIDPLCANIP